MDNEELVTLTSVSIPGEAEVIKDVLEAEGITCFLDGELQGGLTGVGEIRIIVHADDAERARSILEEAEPLEEDDEEFLDDEEEEEE
jgi:hypothetical protein